MDGNAYWDAIFAESAAGADGAEPAAAQRYFRARSVSVDGKGGLVWGYRTHVPLGAPVSFAPSFDLYLVDSTGRQWGGHRMSPPMHAAALAAGWTLHPAWLVLDGRRQRVLLRPLPAGFTPEEMFPEQEPGHPPRHRLWPYLRCVEGLALRHFSEGGFERCGYLAADVAGTVVAAPDAAAVRRAIGDALLTVRLADAEDGLVRELEVLPVADGRFDVRAEVHARGNSNTFRACWSPADGDPRAWLVAALGRWSFLPGSEEYWG